MRTLRCLFAVLALSSALSCGDRGERWEKPLVVEGPVVAEDKLLFLDRTLARLIAVDDRGSVQSHAVPPSPHGLTAHGSEALFVVKAPTSQHLITLDPSSGTRVSIALPRDFDRIHVSPSGSVAVLTFDSRPNRGPLVRNLNEIGLVDRQARWAPRLVSLSTGALAPRQLLFAPGEAFAAILLDDAVALLEIGPSPRLLQIPLGPQGSARLRPRKGVFAPGGDRLFLLTEGSNDVVTIDVIHTEAAFDATVNFLFLPGAGTLHDIAVVEGLEDGVVALWDQDAAFLDGGGDQGRTLATPVPLGVQRILDLGGALLFFHGSPGAPAQLSAAIAAWAPLEDRFGSDRLPGRLLAPPRSSGASVMLPHMGDQGEAAITLSTVEKEDIRLRLRQKPFALSGRPIATEVDGEGTFFVALQTRRPKTSDPYAFTGAVVSLDPTTEKTEGLVLDEEIGLFGLVGASVFAEHPALLGDLTLVPRASLHRNAARRLDGFFATGMMEETR